MKAIATGVTITLPDATLVPARLVACTLHEYGVPFVRPLSPIGEDGPLTVTPLQLAV